MPDQPTVTVIVLNYNGLKHLQECFGSLTKINYPADRLELMMVDNASVDGSVEYVQTNYPQVYITQSAENVGFAAGNNLGAREAAGELVVFLNNDMWVEPHFVQGLVTAMQSSPDVVSASAKILNWDGTKFDFAGGVMQFSGHARQVGVGQPFSPERFSEIEPTLFACGGAMMVDRQIFLDVGGFDEDYFIYFEDVDLGWRLWLLGYEVVFAPEAIVYHRHHGTMNSFSDHRKQVLYRRNALSSVIKNYSDENLGKVLSAVLLASVDGVVRRAVHANQLDPEDYYIKNPKKSSKLTTSLDKSNVSTLVAIQEVVDQLPDLMVKRGWVQQRRRRSDKEIAPLFRRPFLPWLDVNSQSVYTVGDAFGLHQLFGDLSRRVLVISPDILPYPGLPTVGSGLRAWGLGQGLKSQGHEVLFSMPRSALEGREEAVPAEVLALAWTPSTLGAVVHKADVDMVLVCGWSTLFHLSDQPDIPVVLDQHGPHILERAYQKFGDADENAQYKINALRKADFFTCAGKRQMDYFQPWLERADWTEQERQKLTAVIPFSLSPEMPERGQFNEEIIFVYGGVFLPWQDPSVGLSTLVDAMERHNCGKLYLFGGKHPTIPIDTGIFDALVAQLRKSARVVSRGMVPHADLIAEYTRAHVAIDLMARNPERELAFTSRTVEYLWCGLPVIYNDYAELSEYIRDYKAGWIVDPTDREAIATVLDGIFDQPEQVVERGRNAQRLVREQLSWDETIEPLDGFLRHNKMRPSITSRKQPPERNVQYYLDEILRHYRRGGPETLVKESIAFFKRQGSV